MAPPPSFYGSSSSSTPVKVPPSGPKALRGANGPIAIPATTPLTGRPFVGNQRYGGAYQASGGFDNRAHASQADRNGPLRGSGGFQPLAIPFSTPVNGHHASSPAESSKQGASSYGPRTVVHPLNLPASTSKHTVSGSMAGSVGPSGDRSVKGSSSPVKGKSVSYSNEPANATSSHVNGGSSTRLQGEDYKAKFLPTNNVRAPISISLPSFPNAKASTKPPNGIARPPLSPRAERRADPQPNPPPRSPVDSPPPRPTRSPTPPPPNDLPPPPPEDIPPSPPSIRRKPASPRLPLRHSFPPSPPADEPPPPPSEPPPSPPPSFPPIPREKMSPAPPSFHFRELPLRKRTPMSEDEESEVRESDVPGDEAASAESASSPIPSRDPSPLRRASPPHLSKPLSPPPRQVSPSPPPVPPTQPSTSYEPPPSAFRRPGIGNFLVLHDSAIEKNHKKSVIRYDGGEDASPVKDPRSSIESKVLQRGRGSMKHRDELYELEYEWDKNSVGVKLPPPPAAILVTGLNPLTTVDQIGKFFRSHGRIRDIEAKMDLRSGSQLGICWIKFDGPSSGKGTAHDVAVKVVKECDGQRIGLRGDEKIKVVLDGRALLTERAVKAEMARRYPPKVAAPLPPPPPPAVPTPTRLETMDTPRSAGSSTPHLPLNPNLQTSSGNTPQHRPSFPSLPSRPRPAASNNLPNRTYDAPRSFPPRFYAVPPRPEHLPPRPGPAAQPLSSSFIDAPFEAPRSKHRDDLRDSYVPRRRRSYSRSASPKHTPGCSTCSSDSEEDRPTYRRRAYSPYARGRDGRATHQDSKEDEEAAARIKQAVEQNGLAYVHIDSKVLPLASVEPGHLEDHFRAFRPAKVLSSRQGWYILFSNSDSATKAKILDNTAVLGHRLVITVRVPPSARRTDDTASTADKGDNGGKAWKMLTITKKTRPPPKKPSPLVSKVRRPVFSSDSDSDLEVPSALRKSPSRTKPLIKVEDEAPIPEKITDAMEVDAEPEGIPPRDTVMEVGESEIEEEVVIKPNKKRMAKPKVAKGAKKARVLTPVIEIIPTTAIEATPEVAEIRVDEDDILLKKAPSKPKKPVQSAAEKLVSSGAIEDEEDAYWLGQALLADRDGLEPDVSDYEEEPLLEEDHPLYHTSGSWRAEGIRKLPQIQKSKYLPQQNRGTIATEDAGAVTTGRTARQVGRRLAHDMETHRKTAAAVTAESDLFAFNQLRIRKKQLRFARSSIEGYGLYAMESIQTGEMICEYVGELIRAAVAEVREQKYLKQGIGSSYLFRIDNDMVCDATFRGSVSRLINHSCDPSASAKIISINGHSKIVIYARRRMDPGEEILYDYKFPLESDPALRVPCLCGAATCRGWLN